MGAVALGLALAAVALPSAARAGDLAPRPGFEYGYYRAHPKEIGRDGVHLTRTGYRSWARLWVELGGAVVYGQKGSR